MLYLDLFLDFNETLIFPASTNGSVILNIHPDFLFTELN